MKERIGALAGPVAEGMPWLGTFHSIGTKILRRHAELVGLKSNFTILDTDDQIRLIKQVLQAENIDDKRWPARQFAIMMDGWKNRGLEPARVPAGEAEAFANGKGRRIYEFYQERLKILNAADFGDLLLEGLRLLRDNPDVLRRISAALPLHSRRRVPGHEHGPVPVAAAAGAGERGPSAAQHLLRGRRRPVDLRLARRGRRQHPALREGFSRRQGGAARAQLPLDRAHPRRRRAPHRAQRRPARQDAVHRRRGRREAAACRACGIRRKRRASSARTSSNCSAAATISIPSPFSCAPRSRCASSKSASSRWACPIASSAARASTSARKSAMRWRICAASRSPPTISPSSASSTRPSAGLATRRCN